MLIGIAAAVTSAVFVRPAPAATLDSSTWRITLNVGRERGTWMPPDWAASGARLSLPLEVTFTDEPIEAWWLQPLVDPPDPSLGSNTKRLRCSSGRFIGAGGEEIVAAEGGAWCAEPTGRCGEFRLRFYINFPDGCTRNDVNIPAGRVYFTTGCWDGEALEAAIGKSQAAADELADLGGDEIMAAAQEAGRSGLDEVRYFMGNIPEKLNAVRATAQRRERADELMYTLTAYRGSLSRAEGSIEGPRGLKLATSGGLSLKVNDVRNLWGALGEVNIILGRFTVAAVSNLWEAEPDVDGGPLTILNDS